MSSRVSFMRTSTTTRGAAGPCPAAPPFGRTWLLDGLEPGGEATGVALLGPGKGLEPLGDLVEALLAGGLGEARVHLGVLVGLAGDRRLEVVGRRAHRHTGHGVADLGEEVEVAEGVARLALGDRPEQGGHVGVALD